MRLNIRLFFFILILIIFSSRSLVIAQVKPVKIGEKVPDFVFQEILNYSKEKASISDFRGKLLILDFWSTYCSSCITLFPKLKALQEKYKDSLTIFTIGFDGYKPGSIENFLNARAGSPYAVPLPVAVIDENRDSLFRQFFPFWGLPHEIWIDKNGIVIGITSHVEVTDENIKNIVHGIPVNLREKKIIDFSFHLEMPYLVNGNGGGDDDFKARSLLSKFNGRVTTTDWAKWDSTGVRIVHLNRRLQDLYGWAYGRVFNDFKGILTKNTIAL